MKTTTDVLVKAEELAAEKLRALQNTGQPLRKESVDSIPYTKGRVMTLYTGSIWNVTVQRASLLERN